MSEAVATSGRRDHLLGARPPYRPWFGPKTQTRMQNYILQGSLVVLFAINAVSRSIVTLLVTLPIAGAVYWYTVKDLPDGRIRVYRFLDPWREKRRERTGDGEFSPEAAFAGHVAGEGPVAVAPPKEFGQTSWFTGRVGGRDDVGVVFLHGENAFAVCAEVRGPGGLLLDPVDRDQKRSVLGPLLSNLGPFIDRVSVLQVSGPSDLYWYTRYLERRQDRMPEGIRESMLETASMAAEDAESHRSFITIWCTVTPKFRERLMEGRHSEATDAMQDGADFAARQFWTMVVDRLSSVQHELVAALSEEAWCALGRAVLDPSFPIDHLQGATPGAMFPTLVDKGRHAEAKGPYDTWEHRAFWWAEFPRNRHSGERFKDVFLLRDDELGPVRHAVCLIVDIIPPEVARPELVSDLTADMTEHYKAEGRVMEDATALTSSEQRREDLDPETGGYAGAHIGVWSLISARRPAEADEGDEFLENMPRLTDVHDALQRASSGAGLLIDPVPWMRHVQGLAPFVGWGMGLQR